MTQELAVLAIIAAAGFVVLRRAWRAVAPGGASGAACGCGKAGCARPAPGALGSPEWLAKVAAEEAAHRAGDGAAPGATPQ